jgi:hypothetical protein
MATSLSSFHFYSDRFPPQINKVEGGKDNPNKFLANRRRRKGLLLDHSRSWDPYEPNYCYWGFELRSDWYSYNGRGKWQWTKGICTSEFLDQCEDRFYSAYGWKNVRNVHSLWRTKHQLYIPDLSNRYK